MDTSTVSVLLMSSLNSIPSLMDFHTPVVGGVVVGRSPAVRVALSRSSSARKVLSVL